MEQKGAGRPSLLHGPACLPQVGPEGALRIFFPPGQVFLKTQLRRKKLAVPLSRTRPCSPRGWPRRPPRPLPGGPSARRPPRGALAETRPLQGIRQEFADAGPAGRQLPPVATVGPGTPNGLFRQHDLRRRQRPEEIPHREPPRSALPCRGAEEIPMSQFPGAYLSPAATRACIRFRRRLCRPIYALCQSAQCCGKCFLINPAAIAACL